VDGAVAPGAGAPLEEQMHGEAVQILRAPVMIPPAWRLLVHCESFFYFIIIHSFSINCNSNVLCHQVQLSFCTEKCLYGKLVFDHRLFHLITETGKHIIVDS